MQLSRKLYVVARIALVASLATLSAASLAAAEFYYAETTATLSYTTLVGPLPIPGLSLNLPAASTHFNTAVVTLSMPNLFLSHPTSTTIPMAATIEVVAPSAPGGVFVSGGIGCDNAKVLVSGLKPLTIVVKVPLGTLSQLVEAEWFSDGSSTVTTQTFASLSAVLVKE